MQDSAESINQELLKLYQSKREIFSQIYQRKYELNLTLMLPCACEEFAKSKTRLMVMGQENYGWGFKDTSEAVMRQTQAFITSNKSKNSPFWRFVKEFYEGLGKKLENHFASVAYSNVRRVCFNKDKGKDPKKLLPNNMENAFDGLLLEEIQIIQPKIILFLTGPNYDKIIKKQLRGVEFHNIKEFLALNPALPKAEFSLPDKLKKVKVLTHKDLSNTLMLRIYHPRHYYFQPKQSCYQYLETLTKLCKKWLDIQS